MNFPLESVSAVSGANPWSYFVFGIIGFAFGYTLEMAGFGDSRKLAGQFYFRELTVLKVMFTAIAVAMPARGRSRARYNSAAAGSG